MTSSSELLFLGPLFYAPEFDPLLADDNLEDSVLFLSIELLSVVIKISLYLK
jgi:hypothetical protein